MLDLLAEVNLDNKKQLEAAAKELEKAEQQEQQEQQEQERQ